MKDKKPARHRRQAPARNARPRAVLSALALGRLFGVMASINSMTTYITAVALPKLEAATGVPEAAWTGASRASFLVTVALIVPRALTASKRGYAALCIAVTGVATVLVIPTHSTLPYWVACGASAAPWVLLYWMPKIVRAAHPDADAKTVSAVRAVFLAYWYRGIAVGAVLYAGVAQLGILHVLVLHGALSLASLLILVWAPADHAEEIPPRARPKHATPRARPASPTSARKVRRYVGDVVSPLALLFKPGARQTWTNAALFAQNGAAVPLFENWAFNYVGSLTNELAGGAIFAVALMIGVQLIGPANRLAGHKPRRALIASSTMYLLAFATGRLAAEIVDVAFAIVLMVIAAILFEGGIAASLAALFALMEQDERQRSERTAHLMQLMRAGGIAVVAYQVAAWKFDQVMALGMVVALGFVLLACTVRQPASPLSS